MSVNLPCAFCGKRSGGQYFRMTLLSMPTKTVLRIGKVRLPLLFGDSKPRSVLEPICPKCLTTVRRESSIRVV